MVEIHHKPKVFGALEGVDAIPGGKCEEQHIKKGVMAVNLETCFIGAWDVRARALVI